MGAGFGVPPFHLQKYTKHHLTQPCATKTNRNLLQTLDQELEWAGYVGYVWPGMNWADRDTSAASRTTRRGRPPHATSAGSEAILRLSQGNTKDQPSVEQYAVGLCRIPVRDKAALCDTFKGRKGNGKVITGCYDCGVEVQWPRRPRGKRSSVGRNGSAASDVHVAL
jgi:hypothetical protein